MTARPMADTTALIHQVAIEDGPVVPCRANRPVSLECKRQGVKAIMIGCRGGGCGVCRVRVLAGDYRTERMSRAHVTEAEEQAGYALSCCLYPLSDLHIVAAPRAAASNGA